MSTTLASPRLMAHRLRSVLPASFTVAALVAFGCAGRATISQTSGETSGSQTGGQTSGTLTTGGETTGSQTSGTPSTSSSSGGETSTDGGPTTTAQCTPFATVTDLLQSALPANAGYGGVFSDGQHVYLWSGSSLYRIPVTGGAVETIYSGPFVGLFAAVPGAVAWLPMSQPTDVPTGLTVSDGSGTHQVAFPAGVSPAWGNILMDTNGDVFFEANVPPSTRTETWKWSPATSSAAEATGIGMPAAGAGTNLYWADRGQVVWSNNTTGPAAGIYVTDITTGIATQLVGDSTDGFGGMVGLDAANIYGAGSICPMGACTFTVSGVPRTGGPSFVAFQASQAYWTNGLIADDSGLYWIDWVSRNVYHAPLTEGPSPPVDVVVALTGSSIPSRVALDTCNVYWLETDPSGTPHVMAVQK